MNPLVLDVQDVETKLTVVEFALFCKTQMPVSVSSTDDIMAMKSNNRFVISVRSGHPHSTAT
jgi:hypothetical protein